MTVRFLLSCSSCDAASQCNGAFVELKLLPPEERPAVGDDRAFVRFVSTAFAQRRKMLCNSLTPRYDSAAVAAALKGMGLQEGARAQELDLQQFVQLYAALSAQPVQQQ